VRQPYEYEAGHIPGAKWIPLGEIEYRHAELERDKKIITYCRSGHRSMAANTLLCGLGFENVYNLNAEFSTGTTMLSKEFQKSDLN